VTQYVKKVEKCAGELHSNNKLDILTEHVSENDVHVDVNSSVELNAEENEKHDLCLVSSENEKVSQSVEEGI